MLTLLHRPPVQTTTISASFSFFTSSSLRPQLLTTAAPPPPPPLDASIAASILAATPQTLPRILQDPTIQWTPDLVDKTLKRLWNHAPKALSFFAHLSRRRPGYAPAASSFDHAVDLSARVRDFRAAWALVARMRSLRLGPSPKTLAIIAERYVAAGKPDRAVKVFLSMHEHGCRQDLSSFNTILDILCKSRHVEMASNKLFKVFGGRFEADCVSYNRIANGWCLIKRTPMALEVLKEMVDRGLTPTSTTYDIMLKGFFRAGPVDEAFLSADEEEEVRYRCCHVNHGDQRFRHRWAYG